MSAAPPPPTLWNEEAELRVVGAGISHPDLALLHDLGDAEFYDQRNRVLWGALRRLQEQGRTVTVTTLSEALRGRKPAIDRTYLAGVLANWGRDRWGFEANCDIVRSYAQRRDAAKTLTDLSGMAYDPKIKTPELMEHIDRDVFSLLAHRSTPDLVQIGPAMDEAMSSLRDMCKHGKPPGIRTGFNAVDDATTGMHGGEQWIVCARPGMGKSALACAIARNVAGAGLPVAIFNFEMQTRDILFRLASAEMEVRLGLIRAATCDQTALLALEQARQRLRNLPLYIEDAAGQTLAKIRASCRRLALQVKKIGLVVIDYLQLMRPSSARLPREQQISEMSRGLKELAKELDCPVMTLSQLNRKCEERTDKRPMLSDLRESGSIEQDADLVLGVYRDEYYDEDSEEPGIAELVLLKQRNGPTTTVRVGFDGQFTRFCNMGAR